MMFSVKANAMRCVVRVLATMAATFAVGARADAVRNGNEMALNFVSTKGAEKAAVQQKATGVYHTWRFLKIRSITPPTESVHSFKIVTVEPSSDMKVILVTDPSAKLSKKLAATLEVGDCIAGRGRVKSVAVDDANTIVVDPAVLEYKDKSKPEPGKELLKEVDPRAN